MGMTTAPAGRCTGCVGGVGTSCTPCVVVAVTPVFFVRALINVTAQTLPCTVACDPAASMVKPGFTGASPPDAGPPIRVIAALTTHPSNNVLITLELSSFVFGGRD